MKNFDVVAMGELLIDFTENGTSDKGNPVMEANPGGAPCNVLSMLNRTGHTTAFMGKVGDDIFGKQLSKAAADAGIDISAMTVDKDIRTTLAFVHTLPGGDREFSFYRNPGADMSFRPEEVDTEMIKNCKIFHYGSLSMTDEPAKSASKLAIETAKAAGKILSFDPNLRVPLWHSLDDAKREIDYGMRYCDILKISDNEITWFTGIDDYDEAAKFIQNKYNIPLVTLSLGAEGSRAYMNGKRAEVPAFIRKNTIETTGAGDAFMGCVLHYVLENGWRDYTETELTDMLTFANCAASIVTTRRGALLMMPYKDEVLKDLSKNIR